MSGYIYNVNIHLRDNKQFDYSKFLTAASKYKAELIHICLDTFLNIDNEKMKYYNTGIYGLPTLLPQTDTFET